MSPITVWKHSYRPFILVILNFPWFLFSCTTKLSTGLYYLGRMEWGLWRKLVFLVTGILFYLCCLITLSFQKMYIFLGIKENNSWNSLGFCDIMYLKPIPLSFLWRLFFSLPLSLFSFYSMHFPWVISFMSVVTTTINMVFNFFSLYFKQEY